MAKQQALEHPAKRFDENICAQIFSHLAREDKLRCMAVCKTWAAYGYSLTAEILHADLTSKNLIVWRLNEGAAVAVETLQRSMRVSKSFNLYIWRRFSTLRVIDIEAEMDRHMVESILLAVGACEQLVVLKLDDMFYEYEDCEKGPLGPGEPVPTGRGFPCAPKPVVQSLPASLEVLRTNFGLDLRFNVETEPQKLRVFEGVCTEAYGLSHPQSTSLAALQNLEALVLRNVQPGMLDWRSALLCRVRYLSLTVEIGEDKDQWFWSSVAAFPKLEHFELIAWRVPRFFDSAEEELSGLRGHQALKNVRIHCGGADSNLAQALIDLPQLASFVICNQITTIRHDNEGVRFPSHDMSQSPLTTLQIKASDRVTLNLGELIKAPSLTMVSIASFRIRLANDPPTRRLQVASTSCKIELKCNPNERVLEHVIENPLDTLSAAGFIVDRDQGSATFKKGDMDAVQRSVETSKVDRERMGLSKADWPILRCECTGLSQSADGKQYLQSLQGAKSL